MLKNRKIIFKNFNKKKPVEVFEIKKEDFNQVVDQKQGQERKNK